MQAIKEKLNDMGAMRKAKAEAKEEEKAEKELAKARVQVAHEVRLAREAEAAMDLHVNKAAEKVAEHEQKIAHHGSSEGAPTNPGASPTLSTDTAYGSAEGGYAPNDSYGYGYGGAATAGTGGYTGNRTGGPPTDLL